MVGACQLGIGFTNSFPPSSPLCTRLTDWLTECRGEQRANDCGVCQGVLVPKSGFPIRTSDVRPVQQQMNRFKGWLYDCRTKIPMNKNKDIILIYASAFQEVGILFFVFGPMYLAFESNFSGWAII